MNVRLSRVEKEEWEKDCWSEQEAKRGKKSACNSIKQCFALASFTFCTRWRPTYIQYTLAVALPPSSYSMPCSVSTIINQEFSVNLDQRRCFQITKFPDSIRFPVKARLQICISRTRQWQKIIPVFGLISFVCVCFICFHSRILGIFNLYISQTIHDSWFLIEIY